MTRHTRAVTSALLSEALAPSARGARAAPRSCSTSMGRWLRSSTTRRTRTCPEGTRQLLIEIAKRYGVVACVSGRRASEARAMVSIGTISYLGSHGAELLRAGWTEPVLDPGHRGLGAPDPGVRPRGRHGRPAPLAGADRGQGRDRRLPLARRAGRGGGARGDRRARRARRGGGTAHPLGAQGARGAAAGADRQGRRGSVSFLEDADVDVALYVGDDATDVDAFRGLRQLRRRGSADRSAIRVGVSSEEAPSAVAEEADLARRRNRRRARAARGADRRLGLGLESGRPCGSPTSCGRPC